MKIEIKSVFGSVLFSGNFESLAKCVEAAVKSGANLSDANLSGANLSGANLSGAKNAQLAIASTRILPAGLLIGWKKCLNGVIVKLRIPEDAKRSHAFGRKCRADYVEVIDVIDSVVGYSNFDGGRTEYRKGATVRCDKWCDDFTEECAGGIHFFITREEAEAYTL